MLYYVNQIQISYLNTFPIFSLDIYLLTHRSNIIYSTQSKAHKNSHIFLRKYHLRRKLHRLKVPPSQRDARRAKCKLNFSETIAFSVLKTRRRPRSTFKPFYSTQQMKKPTFQIFQLRIFLISIIQSSFNVYWEKDTCVFLNILKGDQKWEYLEACISEEAAY